MLSDSPGSNNWLKEAKIGEFSWAILIPGIPPGSQEAARAAADWSLNDVMTRRPITILGQGWNNNPAERNPAESQEQKIRIDPFFFPPPSMCVRVCVCVCPSPLWTAINLLSSMTISTGKKSDRHTHTHTHTQRERERIARQIQWQDQNWKFATTTKNGDGYLSQHGDMATRAWPHVLYKHQLDGAIAQSGSFQSMCANPPRPQPNPMPVKTKKKFNRSNKQTQ